MGSSKRKRKGWQCAYVLPQSWVCVHAINVHVHFPTDFWAQHPSVTTALLNSSAPPTLLSPPQVAAFHSLVGLAAVCASISSYMASDPSHLDGVHMTATFLVRPWLAGGGWQHWELTQLPKARRNCQPHLHAFSGNTVLAKSTAAPPATPTHFNLQGTLIGAITLTGSAVAFGKLHGVLDSAPLALPGEHWCLLVGRTAR